MPGSGKEEKEENAVGYPYTANATAGARPALHADNLEPAELIFDSGSSSSENEKTPSDHKDFLLTHFDDSSDEESVARRIGNFDFEQAFEDFQSDKADLRSDVPYALVLHSVGLELLYSQEVNKRYYPMKKEQLRAGDDSAVTLKQILTEALRGTVEQVAREKVKQFYRKPQAAAAEQVEELSDADIDDFVKILQANLSEPIESLVSAICYERDLLLVNSFDRLSGRIHKVLTAFREQFFEALLAHIQEAAYVLRGKKPVEEFGVKDDPAADEYKSLRGKLNPYALRKAVEAMTDIGWCANKGGVTVTPTKQVVRKQRSYLSPTTLAQYQNSPYKQMINIFFGWIISLNKISSK